MRGPGKRREMDFFRAVVEGVLSAGSGGGGVGVEVEVVGGCWVLERGVLGRELWARNGGGRGVGVGVGVEMDFWRVGYVGDAVSASLGVSQGFESSVSGSSRGESGSVLELSKGWEEVDVLEFGRRGVGWCSLCSLDS